MPPDEHRRADDLRLRPFTLARLGERAAEAALRLVAFGSIAAILLILYFVAREAMPVVTSAEVQREVTPRALVAPFVGADGVGRFLWAPTSEVPKYSIVPLFLGTLKVTFVAIAVATPLAIAAAVWVAELATPRLRAVVKPTIELLAAVPSVVVGFFALVVLASWVSSALGTTHRLNSIVAGIGLSLAVCPVVFTVSEDALRSVPKAYRSAAMALGSDRFQTIVRVVVPAAAPGIAAAIVLGFGRAIGETMIVVLASGNASIVDLGLGVSTRTVTATIAQELGEVVVGSPHYHVLFVLGALLFVATFVSNLVGAAIVDRMRRKMGTA